jgi:citrate synthase
LGHVEAEMRAAGFPEAIALAWPSASNPQSIVLVLSKGADTARAHEEAQSRLPAYMVPTHFVLLDELPLNLNGKIDRVTVRRLVNTSLAAPPARPAEKTTSELDRVVADALEIDVSSLNDALSLNSISNWDSLGHARLMMALENSLGVEIPQAMTAQLNSFRAIKRYVADTCSPEVAVRADVDEPVHRGLAGLFVENSAISQIDGKRGSLRYSGYNIDELCSRSTFEEVFWLLLQGRLPGKAELHDFSAKLASYRLLPANIIDLLRTMRQAAPSVALRTAVSALSASSDFRSTETETGLRIAALIPCLIATHHALYRDAPLPQPDPALPHAANFARMLLGDKANPAAVSFMQRDLILHADHEANASTFTTRIAIGCGVDLVGAITAAIAAFAGELHGGAVEAAARMFDDIGDPSNAVDYIRDRKRIMGFGHRVYQVEDPRVLHMRSAAAALAHTSADRLCLRIADALVEAMKPRAKFGIAPNVDLYASVAYRSLGIQDDLGTVLGAAGRVAGWVAHALEQRRDNVLVRPRFRYVGPPPRTYPDVGDN